MDSCVYAIILVKSEISLQIQDDDNNLISENLDLGLKQKDKFDDNISPAAKPSSEGTNHSNTSDSHEVACF